MNKAIKNGAQAMQTKNSHAMQTKNSQAPNKNIDIPVPAWNSKQKGTYVRAIHRDLK